MVEFGPNGQVRAHLYHGVYDIWWIITSTFEDLKNTTASNTLLQNMVAEHLMVNFPYEIDFRDLGQHYSSPVYLLAVRMPHYFGKILKKASYETMWTSEFNMPVDGGLLKAFPERCCPNINTVHTCLYLFVGYVSNNRYPDH